MRASASGQNRALFTLALVALFFSVVQAGAMIAITARATGYGSVIMCVNQPPVFQAIDDQVVYVGTTLLLTANATDPDNQSVTYSDDTDLFNVSQNGSIVYLALVGHIGTHVINIFASDNGSVCNATRSTSFDLEVKPAPVPAPEAVPPRGGAGGGGGGWCTIRWQCDDFGPCVNGEQRRECENLGTCANARRRSDVRSCKAVECDDVTPCDGGFVCYNNVCVPPERVPEEERPRVERPARVPPEVPAVVPAAVEVRKPVSIVTIILVGVIVVLLVGVLLALWPPRLWRPSHHDAMCRYKKHRGPHHDALHHNKRR